MSRETIYYRDRQPLGPHPTLNPQLKILRGPFTANFFKKKTNTFLH